MTATMLLLGLAAVVVVATARRRAPPPPRSSLLAQQQQQQPAVVSAVMSGCLCLVQMHLQLSSRLAREEEEEEWEVEGGAVNSSISTTNSSSNHSTSTTSVPTLEMLKEKMFSAGCLTQKEATATATTTTATTTWLRWLQVPPLQEGGAGSRQRRWPAMVLGGMFPSNFASFTLPCEMPNFGLGLIFWPFDPFAFMYNFFLSPLSSIAVASSLLCLFSFNDSQVSTGHGSSAGGG
jgi:hypothetical protein